MEGSREVYRGSTNDCFAFIQREVMNRKLIYTGKQDDYIYTYKQPGFQHPVCLSVCSDNRAGAKI